jgi:flavin-dependent dehydrogenase
MKTYDVIIAGGGPAGSTAAILLAQFGHQVLLLEKAQHPRYHIGESMMPYIDPIMQRLGIDWGVGNLSKLGADFIHEESGRSLFLPLQTEYKTYQIERSVFDEKLFQHAIDQGVEAHQQESVNDVDCHADGVQITTDQASYSGRFFIDATGRSALMGKKSRQVKALDKFGKFSWFQYFQLVNTPEMEKLFATGNVVILLIDIGWLWVIPLSGKRLSVGIVVQDPAKTELKATALFQHYTNASPLLKALLKNATPISELKAEADFSYINQQRFGLRYACCGDASGFLDPVFSTGFYFAVKTAELLADRLHPALLTDTENDAELLIEEDEIFQTGFRTMYLMIERFYSSNMVDNLIFEYDRHARIKAEMSALLAGDLWSDNNLFQQGMLNGRRGAVKY